MTGGKTVTFLGEPDAVLRGENGGGGEPILRLNGASKVEIYDLTLALSRRSGIWVDGGSTLVLRRSKIQRPQEEGVNIVNGTATIEQTEITETQGATRPGVLLTAGEVTIQRSKIYNNAGGGVQVANGQKFTIIDNFIVENRGNGGASIQNPGAGSKFEFNTVADNVDSGGGNSDAGGIFCDANISFANNIIYRNTGGNGGFVQTAGICTYGNSYVSPNNMAEGRSLEFVQGTDAPRDYHLTSSSPPQVREVVGVSCSGLVDYDGEPRPQGGACELGADEIKP